MHHNAIVTKSSSQWKLFYALHPKTFSLFVCNIIKNCAFNWNYVSLSNVFLLFYFAHKNFHKNKTTRRQKLSLIYRCARTTMRRDHKHTMNWGGYEYVTLKADFNRIQKCFLSLSYIHHTLCTLIYLGVGTLRSDSLQNKRESLPFLCIAAVNGAAAFCFFFYQMRNALHFCIYSICEILILIFSIKQHFYTITFTHTHSKEWISQWILR